METKKHVELGLHLVRKIRWRSKLIFLYWMLNVFLPKYLYSYLIFPYQNNYSIEISIKNKNKFNPFKNRILLKKTISPIASMIGKSLTLKLGMLNQLIFSKTWLKLKKKKTSFFFPLSPFCLLCLLKSSHV